MKRNILFISIVLAAFALTGIACKSTPKAAESAQDQASDALSSRAADARQRAIDFESPTYFPSDWERVEAQYADAGNLPRSTSSEIQQAMDAYNSVAEAYDELFKKSVPLYAQAREDEIISVRSELIATGFTRQFPEYLEKADDLAIAALGQYEAEDYYASRDTAARALKEYETLLVGGKLFLARQEIIDRDFISYDPENFDLAEEVALKAKDEYDSGNKEAALNNAEEALLRYNIVLANGWTSYAATRRVSAAEERELALSERANIAAREIFRGAEALYNKAEEKFAEENFSEAGVLFIDAEAQYAISRQETEEKRIRAEEAIRLAEEKIEESNETAIEAERIIEGGSR